MSNIIYLVAGSRNMGEGAITDNGGLYANVGMTNGRSPLDRFRDDDYRKKQFGGDYVVLKQWHVGHITDHQIHKYLKVMNDVRWNKDSNNTEEFLFLGDNASGEKAIQLVESILMAQLPEFAEVLFHEKQEIIEVLMLNVEVIQSELEELKSSSPEARYQSFREDLLEKFAAFKHKMAKKHTEIIESKDQKINELRGDLKSQIHEKSLSEVALSKQKERIESLKTRSILSFIVFVGIVISLSFTLNKANQRSKDSSMAMQSAMSECAIDKRKQAMEIDTLTKVKAIDDDTIETCEKTVKMQKEVIEKLKHKSKRVKPKAKVVAKPKVANASVTKPVPVEKKDVCMQALLDGYVCKIGQIRSNRAGCRMFAYGQVTYCIITIGAEFSERVIGKSVWLTTDGRMQGYGWSAKFVKAEQTYKVTGY